MSQQSKLAQRHRELTEHFIAKYGTHPHLLEQVAMKYELYRTYHSFVDWQTASRKQTQQVLLWQQMFLGSCSYHRIALGGCKEFYGQALLCTHHLQIWQALWKWLDSRRKLEGSSCLVLRAGFVDDESEDSILG